MHVCKACGWVDDEASDDDETINGLNTVIKSLRGSIAQLRSQQHSYSREELEEAQRVYDHWRAKLAPRAKVFSEERQAKVIGRLRESYSVEDLMRAVDGCGASQWHVSHRKVELEYICRNAGLVDGFMAQAPDPIPGPARDEPVRPQLQLVVDPTGVPNLGPLGDLALKYAKHGWLVFPCWPRDKVPATVNGLHAAKRDEQAIIRCWANRPDLNVAIRTGAESGIVVLDVDGEEGFDSLHELEQQFGLLPDTGSVQTPRGGQHFYFLHPGFEVRNTAGWPAPGLDIRGDGGYVLAPPSVGSNGHSYELDSTEELALLPEWMLRMLKQRTLSSANGRRKPAEHWGGVATQGTTAGDRNQLLTSYVGHLASLGMEEPELRAVVWDWNRLHLKPTLDQREVNGTIDSVLRARARNSVA